MQPFKQERDLIALDDAPPKILYTEDGAALDGIVGRSGALGLVAEGLEIGADLIQMAPGSAFPLHVHAGAHILVGVAGVGCVHIDGVDYRFKKGDTIYIPAAYPHGVKTIAEATASFDFVAVGCPHKAVDALDRMQLVG